MISKGRHGPMAGPRVGGPQNVLPAVRSARGNLLRGRRSFSKVHVPDVELQAAVRGQDRQPGELADVGPDVEVAGGDPPLAGRRVGGDRAQEAAVVPTGSWSSAPLLVVGGEPLGERGPAQVGVRAGGDR